MRTTVRTDAAADEMAELRQRLLAVRCAIILSGAHWEPAPPHMPPGSEPCWLLPGSSTGGRCRVRIGGGRRIFAYRLAYIVHVGPIPDGMVLDHLCRRASCVQPTHLEAVTPSVNSRRWHANRLVSEDMWPLFELPAQREGATRVSLPDPWAA